MNSKLFRIIALILIVVMTTESAPLNVLASTSNVLQGLQGSQGSPGYGELAQYPAQYPAQDSSPYHTQNDIQDPSGFDTPMSPLAVLTDGFYYEENPDGTLTITGAENPTGDIVIPETLDGKVVTIIGYRAFYDCRDIASVILPNSITELGGEAFYWCLNLTNLYIPDGVIAIGSNAFGGCYRMTSITIPDNVAIIGYLAFDRCTGLLTINIGKSLSSLIAFRFEEYTNLENITVNEENEYYSSLDGVLFNREKSVLIKFPAAKEATEYTIPDGVTRIEDNAFYRCNSLTEITMPDIVTSIGSDAFYWCNSLIEITIPDSVTSIGSRAFYMCNSLTEITIPDNVATIGSYAFYSCIGLTTINIGNSLQVLDCFATVSNGWSRLDGYENLTNINVNAENASFSSLDGVLFNKDKTTIISYPRAKEETEYAIP